MFTLKKYMRSTFTWYSYLLFLPLLILIVNSCEDPGVVGTEFTQTGASVISDTLKVDDYKMASDFPVFTGNKPFLSVGQYSDALFGDLTATGVMRPAINQSEVDTLHPEATLSLELIIAPENVYGDTNSTTQIEIVEFGRIWRGPSWKIDSELDLTSNTLATVEVGMQDSVVVELPDSWYRQYRDFFYNAPASRDSVYRYNFKGLALKPVQGNKILAINGNRTNFLLMNPDDTVGTDLNLGDWGYALNRSNVSPLPDSLNRLYSTQEQVLNFNFKSNRKTLGSENISRAELALFTDDQRLNESLPQGHVRPTPDVLNLYLRETESLKFSLATYQPQFRVQLDSVDYSFRVDLTRYVNQQLFADPIKGRFIGTLRSNDGIIRSTVISNQKAVHDFPKLLLTNVNPDNASN